MLAHAVLQGGIHPVAMLMAAAVASAVAIRLIVRRFAADIARRLDGRSDATFRYPVSRANPEPVAASRWRRLEAARTGFVVSVSGTKVSGTSGP